MPIREFDSNLIITKNSNFKSFLLFIYKCQFEFDFNTIKLRKSLFNKNNMK